MTQFKEKSEKHEANVGLFDYPVLMAADILLYQTDEVPVGEDQKQHIELTRDLAEKFNKKFGDTFKLPNPVIQKETARIMSLQNPLSKMSKSDANPLGTINLLDSEEQIREKIKRAVTDSGTEVSFGKNPEDKPAISNLLTIYCVLSGESPIAAEETFRGKNYGEFKRVLADLLVSKLSKIQKEYTKWRADDSQLRQILNEGRDYVREKSSKTLQVVKKKMGLI
jgi:tryptophanyl-tRNA synthetase